MAALKKTNYGGAEKVPVSRFPSSMRFETSGKSEHGFVPLAHLLSTTYHPLCNRPIAWEP